jgi:hypothetical protein
MPVALTDEDRAAEFGVGQNLPVAYSTDQTEPSEMGFSTV